MARPRGKTISVRQTTILRGEIFNFLSRHPEIKQCDFDKGMGAAHWVGKVLRGGVSRVSGGYAQAARVYMRNVVEGKKSYHEYPEGDRPGLSWLTVAEVAELTDSSPVMVRKFMDNHMKAAWHERYTDGPPKRRWMHENALDACLRYVRDGSGRAEPVQVRKSTRREARRQERADLLKLAYAMDAVEIVARPPSLYRRLRWFCKQLRDAWLRSRTEA